MAIFERRIRRDEAKVILHLWGSIGAGETLETVVLDPKELTGDASHLKLIDCVRFIQKDLCLLFYWEGADDHTLMLPLEGTGKVDLYDMDGFLDPKNDGWTGRVVLKIDNVKNEDKHFSVILEFNKQRG